MLHSPWELVTEALRKGQRLELPVGEVWPEKHTPFGLREAHLANLALFSNPWAHAEFARQVGDNGLSSKSFYMPFPVAPNDDATAPQEHAVAFMGSPSPEHRAHKLLQALASMSSPPDLVWLLDANEREWAESLCRDFGVTRVRFEVGRSPKRWQEMLWSCSVAVHTLFSVYGSLGPYLYLSLAHGIPCITTKFGAGEHLPPLATVQINPGDSEAHELAGAIRELSVRMPWGAAREYVREVHGTRVVASELALLFRREREEFKTRLEAWEEMQRGVARDVLATVLSKEDPSVARFLDHEFTRLGWRV